MLEFIFNNLDNFIVIAIFLLFLRKDSVDAEGYIHQLNRLEEIKKTNQKRLNIQLVIAFLLVTILLFFAYSTRDFGIDFFSDKSPSQLITMIFFSIFLNLLNFIFWLVIIWIVDVFVAGLGYKRNMFLSGIIFPIQIKEDFYSALLIIALNGVLFFKLFGTLIY